MEPLPTDLCIWKPEDTAEGGPSIDDSLGMISVDNHGIHLTTTDEKGGLWTISASLTQGGAETLIAELQALWAPEPDMPEDPSLAGDEIIPFGERTGLLAEA